MVGNAGRFQPGHPGGPGRPRILADVIELARAHTTDAIGRLAAIVTDPDSHPAAAVRAAEVLLNRGWGQAPVNLNLGGDSVIVRRFVRSTDATPAAPAPTPPPTLPEAE